MIRRLLVIWFAAQFTATALHVPIWHSELTVWAHAMDAAPSKPRPYVNFAKALVLTGRTELAQRALVKATAVADGPTVPVFDRRDALVAIEANLQTIAVMQAVLGMRE